MRRIALGLPLRGWWQLFTDIVNWIKEPTHPVATDRLVPSPLAFMFGVALVSIVLSRADLPGWSALNISVLWIGWVV
jgi:hypothetical protein